MAGHSGLINSQLESSVAKCRAGVSNFANSTKNEVLGANPWVYFNLSGVRCHLLPPHSCKMIHQQNGCAKEGSGSLGRSGCFSKPSAMCGVEMLLSPQEEPRKCRSLPRGGLHADRGIKGIF